MSKSNSLTLPGESYEDKFNRVMSQENEDRRLLLAFEDGEELRPEQMMRVLADKSNSVVCAWLMRDDIQQSDNKEVRIEMHKLLRSASWQVRSGAIAHMRTLTEEDVNAALMDNCEEVRASVTRNKWYELTTLQVEKVLTDASDKVRGSCLENVKIELTDLQIRRALNDRATRYSAIQRKEFEPTEKELEVGLTSDDFTERLCYAFKKNVVFSPDQIERGLNDIERIVRHQFEQNKEEMQARWERQVLIKEHSAPNTRQAKTKVF